MLTIVVNGQKKEYWDERKEEFVTIETKTTKIVLEHSLVSISKWESKWRVPFLSKKQKTREELIDYIKCMTITQNVDPMIYETLPNDVMQIVGEYINAPMTASWVHDEPASGFNREQVTSELIYYWMISLNIPVEFQKWHLNRLLMLIRICNAKNRPDKKNNMSKADRLRQRHAINQARRKKYNTKG